MADLLFLVPTVACFARGTDPAYMARIQALMDLENSIFTNADYHTLNRWPGGVGTPVTLTWSFVPDGLSIPSGVGEPIAPSNLFATLDAAYASQGGRAAWVRAFLAVR